MKKSRLIYTLMLSSAFMSFKANATEYRDCPPDVCTSHEGYSMCSKCVYNENNQVIAAGYMEEGRFFVPREYRKYDDGKLIEAYACNTGDDGMLYATQYLYNDAGQLIQENTKSEYYEGDFINFSVSDYTYGDFNGQEHTYSYNYDNAGHLTEKYSDGQLAAKYNYDNDGTLIGKEMWGEGRSVLGDRTPLWSYYSYDDNGNLTSVIEDNDEEGYHLIHYDSNGNITSIDDNIYFNQSFDYQEWNDEIGDYVSRKALSNGKTLVCVGQDYCESYYLEDENGKLSECSSLTKALLGITIEDEQRANAPQSQRFELSDGSTKIIDADGKVHYEGKRIYTIDEANAVAGTTNHVKIRYR